MPVPWMPWDCNDVKLEFGSSNAAFPGEHYHSKWRSENAGIRCFFRKGADGTLVKPPCQEMFLVDGRWWKQILRHFFLKSNENIGHSQYQLVSGISEPSTVLCSVSLNVNPFVLLLRWIPEMSCWCFNFGDSDLMVDVSWKDEIFTELMPECHGWAQFWKV